MKKNGVLLAMMMVTSTIFAQKSVDRSAMAEKQAMKMKTELKLNDEQFGKIKQINENFRTNSATLMADTTRTREDKMLERKRIQEERSTQIKGVLTEEQYTQWTALKDQGKQQNERHERVKPGDRAKKEMDELKTVLALTDDQYKKMATINERIAGRVKQLRTDSTVTRQNFRGEMKKVLDERMAAIKKVLTEAQYGKFVAYEEQKANNRKTGDKPAHEKIKKG